jgi:hypothetical protein
MVTTFTHINIYQYIRVEYQKHNNILNSDYQNHEKCHTRTRPIHSYATRQYIR